MRTGRLLLPWGLLAGLLLLAVACDGLSIKAPSLLKKSRHSTNVTTPTPTTTSTTTELLEEDDEEEEELEVSSESTVNVTAKSHLTGNPQEDYRYDPNLPRELPPGYNLDSYPFFSRVPSDVKFNCTDDLLDGYYANVEHKCQVYHHCLSGIRYDFLCANYTAFDQKTFICHFVSEVDCANSAKFWNRNKGLYETPTTSTVKPLTTAAPATPAPARRPASGPASGGRRRRPYRRRRPMYDYYYDEEYDDEEYEDEANPPVQNVGRGVGNTKKRTDAAAAAVAAEAPTDDKPFKADSSIYDRPRQAPKIRRPVPVNEREKYEYNAKDAGEKKKEDVERPAERDYDKKRPQENGDYDKPRAQDASRARPKPRPALEDDEYYDDEDYDQPRTTSRKNNQDYYAPSGGDRDFGRRPAMTGQGRPLRRNRPGARRRPADDDYYDDRRPYRGSSEEEPRRRPAARDEEPRRRPSNRDDEPRRRPSTRDDEPRRRPAADDEPRDSRRRPAEEDSRRRPAEEDSRRRPAEEETRRRPAEEDTRRRPAEEDTRRRPAEESTRRRPAEDDTRRRPAEEDSKRRPAIKVEDDTDKRSVSSEEDVRRRPIDEDTRRRPAEEDSKRRPVGKVDDDVDRRPSSSEEDIRRRPADEEPRRRPAVVEEDVRRKPTASEEDPRKRLTVNPRKRVPQRDEFDDRTPPSGRDTARPQSSRDSAYDKPTGRESNYERSTSRIHEDRVTERSRSRVIADTPLSPPTGPGSTYIRPLTSRGQSRDSVDSEAPIPAAKPAYISTTGRGSYRQRTHDEESREEVRLPPTGSAAYRGAVRNTPKPVETTTTARPTPRTTVTAKTTEAPLYDDEYYDDEEEEGVEGVPTGPERVLTPAVKLEVPPSPVTPVRKPAASRGREEVYDDAEEVKVDVRSGEDRRADTRQTVDKSSEVDGTGRAIPTGPERNRFVPTAPERVRVVPTAIERIQARPIAEQPPVKRPPSSSYHFNSDDVLVEVSTRRPFRPHAASTSTTTTTTTEPSTTASFYEKPVAEEAIEHRHNYQSNFRRKSNQASNIESTKILPSKDELRDIEDVYQPVTQSTTTSPPPSTTAPPLRLETEKFEVRKPLDALPPTGKASIHFLKHAVRFPDEYPRRGVLPDITDPEYDVTLNEAVHPTRLPLDGTTRIKVKVPIYQYGSALDSTGPGHLKKIPTLLSSASQTHIAKAPFPVHDKLIQDEEYDDAALEDDYEDTAIPTGKGATKPMYHDPPPTPTRVTSNAHTWTTYPSVLRGSEASLPPNRAATGHYILQTPAPRPGFQAPPPQRSQQQYLREPTVYHGALSPLAFNVGYDYDYRPQRKYVRRGAYDYFGKPY